jgi:uncharacterized membrane protein
MTMLIAAAAAFLAIHLFVSGTRLRDVITAKIGEGPYMGLFSLSSVAILVWMGMSYGAAMRGDNAIYWAATPALKHAQLALMLIAVLLAVPGIMTRNPTSVRGGGALKDAGVVRGMVRISRHPFLWGAAIWAGGHMLVNGDRASLIFFGTLFVLSMIGTRSIDAKRARAYGADWTAFKAQTSNVPFAAIFGGRQTLKLGEIGALRIGAALAVYAALIFTHAMLFGVSPLPNG